MGVVNTPDSKTYGLYNLLLLHNFSQSMVFIYVQPYKQNFNGCAMIT